MILQVVERCRPVADDAAGGTVPIAARHGTGSAGKQLVRREMAEWSHVMVATMGVTVNE